MLDNVTNNITQLSFKIWFLVVVVEQLTMVEPIGPGHARFQFLSSM